MKPSKEIVAELLEAKSVDILASFGSVEYLLTAINEVYHPFELHADTYERLYEAIEAVRASFLSLKSYPFVSRQAEAVFALTELDGTQRNTRLGYTKAISRNKRLSHKWYRSVAQLVHSDKINNDPVPMQLLEDLYEKITHASASKK